MESPDQNGFVRGALMSSGYVAAVDSFIRHTFSEDLLHASHLAELWGLKEALKPCLQVGYNLGTKSLIVALAMGHTQHSEFPVHKVRVSI